MTEQRSLADAAFERWPTELLGWLMLGAVALNLANIVGRYVFGWAIVWTEEVLVVWLTWSVFIGVVVVTYRGEHLAMDLLSTSLPGRWRIANNLLIAVAFAACLLFAAVQSAKVVQLMLQTGQTHPSIGLPLWIPNLAICAGLALSFCALVLRARAYVTGRF